MLLKFIRDNFFFFCFVFFRKRAVVCLIFLGVVGGLPSSCLEEASKLASVPCTASDVKISNVALSSPPTDSTGSPLPSRAVR